MNIASPPPVAQSRARRVVAWMSFLTVAIVGLASVKWVPYYEKSFAAASHHSIGSSILMGSADAPPAPSLGAALEYSTAYAKAIWKALVLGLLLGSAVQALLPRRWIVAALGGSGLRSVVVGGILAVPGMMCTCCAAPVVAGLRQCRAAPGAAVAFWLGNTVLNPATLVFTGFVLGWNWTGLRLVAGLAMVFGLGWIVSRLAQPGESVAVEAQAALADADAQPSFARWPRLLWQMSLRLIPEYAVLVLLLGAARAWLFPHVGHEIDNSIAWILAFAAAGTIFVIPTAGEIPIIQAMLALGVGVGPAGALLMTLPPVSAPSVAMLWRSFRARTLALVCAGVIAMGVATGLAATALLA